MAEQTHSVVYRAIAEFDDARKKAREFRDELRALKAEQEGLNRSTATGSQQAEQSQRRLTQATSENAKVTDEAAKSSRRATEETRRLGSETDRTAAKFRSIQSIGKNFGSEFSRALATLSSDMRRAWKEAENGETAFQKLRRALAATGGGGGGGTGFFTVLAGGADALGRSVTSLLGKFTFWPAIIAAVAAAAGPLVAILGSLGAVALSAASTIVSLSGALAALPGGIFAAATGIGALIAAITPLAGALKAYQAAQDAASSAATRSGTNSRQQAEQVRAAQRSVEQANHSVADAERGVAEARRGVTEASRGVEAAHRNVAAAARDVEDAEYNLAQAQYDSRQAQLDVNEARREALRDLQDLQREVDRANLTEERAVLNLVRAQQDYNKVVSDPTASLIDRREATLRVQEAEADLADTRRENADNAAELAKAESAGVEGSNKVVDAKKAAADAVRNQQKAEQSLIDSQQSLVDANRKVADAQQSVADAQQRVADAEYRLSEAHKNVQDATYRLADAQNGGASGANAAATAQAKYQEALDKLSPSARTVLKAVIDLKKGWDDVSKTVQEAIFQPVVAQLGNLRSLLPVVEDLLAKSGAAIGTVAANGIAMISSGPWTKDFADQAKSNAVYIQNLGTAGLFLLDALRNISRAADPFTKWLTEALKQGAANFDSWAKSARSSGSIDRFLEVTKKRLQEVWDITKNVAATLLSWAKAAEPFTDWINGRLKDITSGWRDVAKAQESATSPLQTYLQNVKPLLTEVAKLFGDLGRSFASAASDTSNIERAIALLQTLRTEVFPALGRILNELGKSGIDQALANALAEILDAFATFLNSGGGQALSTFVNVLAGFVSVLAEIASLPGVSQVIGAVATSLAAVAAVSIVARFSGLFKLVDAFRWFVANRGNLVGAFSDTARGLVGIQRAVGDPTATVPVVSTSSIGPVGSEVLNNQAKATEKVGEAARIANGKVSIFSRTVSGLKTAGSTAVSGLGGLTSFLGGPWGIALLAATALIGVVAGKLAHQKEEANQTKDAFLALKNAYDELSKGDTSGIDDLQQTNDKFKDITTQAQAYGLSLKDVSGALNNQQQDLGRVNAQIDTQIAQLRSARDVQIAYAQSQGDTTGAFQEGITAIDDQISAAERYKKQIGDVAAAQSASNNVLADSARLSRTYEERLYGLSQQQAESISLSGDYDIQIRALSGALDTLSSSTSSAKDRSEALSIIIKSETDDMINANEATENFNRKILDLDDSVKANGRSLKDHTREGLNNRDALEAAAGAARELFLQDIASKVPMDEATNRHRERINKLKEEAHNLGLNKTETDKLIKKYGEVPKDLQTKIKPDKNGFQNVYNDLRRLQYMQDALRRGLSPQAAEDEWKKAEGRRVADQARASGTGGSASGTGFYKDGGPVYGEGTRNSDSIRAWLSNGEYVQPTDAVEYYGMPVMEALRQRKFDRQAINEALPDSAGGYKSGGKVLPKFANGGTVNIPFVVTPKNTKIDENWVYGPGGGSLGNAGGSGGWQWQMSVLHKQFPGLQLISGYRPGSRTLSGNQSYHALGRAVDLPPRRDVAQWIHDTYGKRTKELITPYQDLNLWNGSPHRYTGAIWNQHNFAGGNAHDHWAFRNGGLVGGAPQFGFPAMASGGMLSAQAMPGATDRQLSQAAQSVINQNRGITVENLNVNNPVPERASDSLSRQVTKLAVLGDI